MGKLELSRVQSREAPTHAHLPIHLISYCVGLEMMAIGHLKKAEDTNCICHGRSSADVCGVRSGYSALGNP